MRKKSLTNYLILPFLRLQNGSISVSGGSSENNGVQVQAAKTKSPSAEQEKKGPRRREVGKHVGFMEKEPVSSPSADEDNSRYFSANTLVDVDDDQEKKEEGEDPLVGAIAEIQRQLGILAAEANKRNKVVEEQVSSFVFLRNLF
jgi:hypothetical protein